VIFANFFKEVTTWCTSWVHVEKLMQSGRKWLSRWCFHAGAANYCGDIRRPFVGRDALGTPLIADLQNFLAEHIKLRNVFYTKGELSRKRRAGGVAPYAITKNLLHLFTL